MEKCLRNAHLLKSMLERAGVKTMLNELSSTVVFERPREEAFVRKWQLACEGDIAHVVVMPNITIRKLEHFVQELFESRWVAALGAAAPAACKLQSAGSAQPHGAQARSGFDLGPWPCSRHVCGVHRLLLLCRPLLAMSLLPAAPAGRACLWPRQCSWQRMLGHWMMTNDVPPPAA